MSNSRYSRFGSNDLILTDELAIDRTLLANERTLLAYLRSAIALLIAGVTIIHFIEGGWFRIVGIVCIPSGIAAALVGIARFRQMNRAISLVRKQWERQAKEPRTQTVPAPSVGSGTRGGG